MKNRTAVTHWLLALLLLLSQQLAVVHAVSHVTGARTETSQDKQLPADQVCAHCVTFAQIGSALTGHAHALADDGINDAARPIAPNKRARNRILLAFHSRAPPAFA